MHDCPASAGFCENRERSRSIRLRLNGIRILEMARPKRFELLTPRFVVWCSIQLSYGRFGAKGRTRKAGRVGRSIAKGLIRCWQGLALESVRHRPAVVRSDPLACLAAPAAPRRSPPSAAASGALALAAPRAELDRTVRNGEPEGRPDRAVDQPDVAAVDAHELGGNREPKPGAARAGRPL